MTGPTSPQIATISGKSASGLSEKEAVAASEKLGSGLPTKKVANDLSAGHTIKIKVSEATSDGVTTVHWTERYPAKAKAVIWNFVQNSTKIYETKKPNKTMKYIAVGSAVLLFLGVLSLVLAQKDEQVPSNYGMAFPLDESASSKAEKRVLFGIPGEGTAPTPASDASVTTTEPATELPTTVKADEGKEQFEGIQSNPAIMIAGDEDDKEDNDQRIVFIERLMGLHLTAPTNGQKGDEAATLEGASSDPKQKVNAKWASRTRKFSIPLPSEAQPNQAIPSEQPHPMLRYAAAAMMSRLIAAAARAQMEAQAREAISGGAKDKDDREEEDESVPVLLATLRDEQMAMRARQSPPMYGRPMPRPMMRPQPPTIQQRQAMASMAQRLMASPSQQASARSAPSADAPHPMLAAIQQLQALQAIQHLQSMQRQGRSQSQEPQSAQAALRAALSGQSQSREAGSGSQQALAMVVIPIQSQESRQMAQQMSPYAGAGHQQQAYAAQAAYARPSYYPSGPYGASPYAAASPYHAYGYRQMAHPHPAASYAMPMHMPPAHPMHYGQHPHYAAASPYPTYARPMSYGPYAPRAAYPHPAYSHMRNVIEVPVEVPVPVHVPVPVAVRADLRDPREQLQAALQQAIQAQRGGDQDSSSSDQDHIVLLYDAEVQDQEEGEDLQQSASDLHEKMAHGGPKGHHFLERAMPSTMSANKMKLFRELMGAKHAAQPGVRYMPISMVQEESQQQSAPHHGQFQPQQQQQQQQVMSGQESQQPAFIVLSNDQDQEQPQVRRRR